MLRERRGPVLIAVADRAVRQRAAQPLREAGFVVQEAQDYEEAVALLYASPRRLVVLVGRDQLAVLHFAASNRRLVHHHVYIVLDTAAAPVGDAVYRHFPYLMLWRLESLTPHELTEAVARAADVLGADRAHGPALVTH